MADASGGTPLDRNPAAGTALSAARGKIAVIEGFALPNFVSGLEAAGAIAVIAVNPGERIHWGTVSTVWGTPEPEDLARLPRIPSAAVNQPDGQRLIALARNGATATVATTLGTGWHMQKLPVAEIPGTDGTGDFVLLHGHYDSWREGVGDNGTGNACMLEVARVLWGQPRQPAPVGPYRLVAQPFDRPLRRLRLVRRHLHARPRRALRRAPQLRQPRLPLGHQL